MVKGCVFSPLEGWGLNGLLLGILIGKTFVEEAAESVFVRAEGFATLGGDAADGAREAAETCLRDIEVASLLQGCYLHTHVAPRGVGDIAQVHEVGTLQTVECDHDLQPQLIVQHWVDDGKLEITHG